MPEAIDSIQYIVRPTTEEEFNSKMPYLTNSMVEAINTCPRWGLIHNVQGKRFVTGYRQMALEAGSLMHDALALLNLFHIGLYRGCPAHMHYHGAELFGESRWVSIYEDAIKKIKPRTPTPGDKEVIERAVFSLISSSDFYDDPNDRNRTVANLEQCAMQLIDYWLIHLVKLPIYIADEDDPSTKIGIEMSLDCVFELKYDHLEEVDTMRCIGLADVVYQSPDTKRVSLGEYKTASRINDAWRASFDTRHQITLYNALLQAFFGKQSSFDTILIGSTIPVLTTTQPVQHFMVSRDQENIEEMLRAFLHARDMIETFNHNPLTAPMFTHSCNRYFRPCGLLDLCTAAKEDRNIMYETMTIDLASSPSEQKALLRHS